MQIFDINIFSFHDELHETDDVKDVSSLVHY
jgi:hypothetical protein